MLEASESGGSAGDALPDEEFQAEDGEFVGVRISSFYSPKSTMFDLFLRLGKGRYLRVFEAGESYEEDVLRQFETDRGVRQVYFRRENRSRYVFFLWTILQRTVPLASVKVAVKFAVARTLSELWMQELYLSTEKNRPVLLEDGRGICGTLASWIETDAALEEYVLGYSDVELSLESISFLTGIFAAVASHRFPWKSRKSTETILLASFLCDLGLSSLPPELSRIRPKRMTEAQRAEYQKHPELSCQLLACCKTLPENVIAIVREHHEYCDGSGYPQQLKGNRVLLLSKLVCLCGDLVRTSGELLLPPREAVMSLFPVLSQKLFTQHPEIAAKYAPELMLQFFSMFPQGKEGAKT